MENLLYNKYQGIHTLVICIYLNKIDRYKGKLKSIQIYWQPGKFVCSFSQHSIQQKLCDTLQRMVSLSGLINFHCIV